ncbi:helix-turn-helix transcriptional regulator [Nocardiopsis dassonvillei]|uniref:Scr1 family TA system antitoxin-like transcriptional regulator n=1 Tax=Nocardiopsis dassonvillei TaxID=2014 RepID=UPI00200C68FC|nr:Scr1 family TA system antitoxin-like transcriptional regulator [Nocardiopsis dassonvillei]MCK9870167.1 helix-turn-helix transcriptional regulator [Nocardiopsis dassonvillei]
MEEHPLELPSFGAALQGERKNAGFTLRKLASVSHFAVSTLSRWENDKTTPVRADVVKLDEALGARGHLLSEWESATGVGFPPWMRSPGAREERAVAIDTVSVNLVPGLIQSPLYARAAFRAFHPRADNSEIERLAQLRVSRYEALISRNDPLVTAVFPLGPLRYLPQDVKEDQVKHLLRHLERGRLIVYLIPETTPILAVSSSAQVYHLPDSMTVASSDHVRGNVVLEKPGDTETVESLVRDLIGLASPPG